MNMKKTARALLALALAVEAAAAGAAAPWSPRAQLLDTLAARHANAAATSVWTAPLDWLQVKLEAPDPGALDAFGATIAMSGDTAFIAAPNRPANSSGFQGAVYVFTRAGGEWTQTQTLTADDAGIGDEFGSAIALQGSTAVIGAPLAKIGNVAQAGAAYVFHYDGAQWTQVQKLTTDVPHLVANFGSAVALDGSHVLVGAPGIMGPNGEASVGAAYLFSESGGVWSPAATLTASAAHALDLFGISVGIAGETAVVGASQATWVDGASGPGPGRVYVYQASPAGWSETGYLLAGDGVDGDYFGEALVFDGHTLVIGAPAASDLQGAAYVFEPSADSWRQSVKLMPPDGEANAFFGRALALAGTSIAVGAPGVTANGNPFAGAAYLFSAVDGVWSPSAQSFSTTDGVTGDYLGFAVGVLDGETVLAGAPHELNDGLDAPGAAYAYRSDVIFRDGFDGGAAR